MIKVDFLNNKYIAVELKEEVAANIVFYILEGANKIYIRYLTGGRILLKKSIIENKSVRFQFYYEVNQNKKVAVTRKYVFKEIDCTLYKLIISSKLTYSEIKEKGYKSVDGAISIDLNDKINWRTRHHNFNFNINSLRFLSAYWQEYFKSHDEAILKDILLIIRQYADFMRSDNKKGRFVNYDMAIGIRSLHISLLMKFYFVFSSRDIELIEWMYFKHVELSSNPQIFKLSNHGVWLIYGLRVLLYSKNDIDKTKLEYCNAQFTKLLDFSFTDEAMSVENSPYYHQYNIALYRKIPLVLFPENRKFQKILVDSAGIIPWLVDENHYFYQIGDSEGRGKKVPSKINVKPEYIDNLNCYYKNFFKSGYVFLKKIDGKGKAQSEFVFYNTSSSKIHKHLDGNSFIFFYQGVEVFADGGKYAYEYTKIREYFTSSFAHNTLSLTTEPVCLADLDLDGTGLQKSSFVGGVLTVRSIVSYINKFNHTRKVVCSKNSIFLHDSIENHTESNITLNFLFGCKIELVKDGSVIYLRHKGEAIGKLIISSGYIDIKIIKGGKIPYKGWISKSYKKVIETNSLEIIYPSKFTKIFTEVEFYA